MATAHQIKALLKSYSRGDDEHFLTVALQIAANEAGKGHSALAQEIKKIVEDAQSRKSSRSASNLMVMAQPQGDLANLLEVVESHTRLGQMVIPQSLRLRLNRIVREQKNFSKLREHFLLPRQKILLLGPPGCGKTMTAYALAGELGLPLFIVRLDAIFTKFLGETASKLRLVFDTIGQNRAVYLFDEFDSLGLSRGSHHDVAEMRRVLNSFLVFLENLKGNSLVVAASNHPDALDSALFRRFDDLIRYTMPTVLEIEQVLRNHLAVTGVDSSEVTWPAVLKQLDGLSHAEVARVANEAVKEMLIESRNKLTTDVMLTAIAERKQHLN
jgi:SpoVK/Ycf46/Vps4 family AAA+-type ATPase